MAALCSEWGVELTWIVWPRSFGLGVLTNLNTDFVWNSRGDTKYEMVSFGLETNLRCRAKNRLYASMLS